MVVLSACSKKVTTEQQTAETEGSKVQAAVTKEGMQSAMPLAMQEGKDYHSFANPDEIKVTHLVLDLTVDFSVKVLSGEVEVVFERVKHNAKQLILDTRYLTIQSVSNNGQ
jgi:hypothetical protein